MPLPPGPDTAPIVQLARYRFQPFDFLDECARRHGDLFTLRFPIFDAMVCASHPDAIRRIFAASSEELRLGEGNAVFRSVYGERSLPVIDGPDHLRLRRLSVPMFHGDEPHALSEMMLEVAARMVDGWREGTLVRLRPEMDALTLEIILRVLFGLEDPAELRAFERCAKVMVRWSASPAAALLVIPGLQRDLGPVTPWHGFKRDMARLTELVRAQVERRHHAGDADRRADVLSRLLVASEGGAALDDAELLDLLLMLIFAGYETTSTSLCWAFEAILSHPAEWSRLDQELRAVTGGGPLRPEHLPGLTYLEAAIKEVLRLFPVVPIVGMGRMVVQPFEVQGIELPPGTKLVPTSYLTQRRADLYPAPERFLPARFLGEKPDPACWLPFGGGLRRCVGLPFALHELRVVLAYVLGRTRLRLKRAAPARGGLEGVTVGPEGGTPVIVERVFRRDGGTHAARAV